MNQSTSVSITDISFEKWQAARNDFIVVALLAEHLRISMKQLLRYFVRLCVRDGTGIGADGIIVVCEYQQQVMVWIINADGSLAKNCGNGLRCAARYYFLRHAEARQVAISVGNRKMLCARIQLDGYELIATNMGQALVDRQLSWFGELEQLAGNVATELDLQLQVHACELGNRHAVFFSTAEHLQALGEKMQAFADGINVHCVWESSGYHEARSYERGVGITPACGSGAGAIAALLARQQPTSEWQRISMLGGLLFARKVADEIIVAGKAEHVYSGSVTNKNTYKIPLSGEYFC